MPINWKVIWINFLPLRGIDFALVFPLDWSSIVLAFIIYAAPRDACKWKVSQKTATSGPRKTGVVKRGEPNGATESFPRFFHTAPQIEQIKCREIGGNEGKQRNSHVGGQCPWWGVIKWQPLNGKLSIWWRSILKKLRTHLHHKKKNIRHQKQKF